MNAGDLVFAAAAGALSAPYGGLWAGRVKDGTLPPYGIYQTTRDPQTYLSGAQANMQHETVQIDIYATTTAQANTLADAVETAMLLQRMDSSPPSFTATELGRENAPADPETQARRVMLTFSIWFRLN